MPAPRDVPNKPGGLSRAATFQSPLQIRNEHRVYATEHRIIEKLQSLLENLSQTSRLGAQHWESSRGSSTPSRLRSRGRVRRSSTPTVYDSEDETSDASTYDTRRGTIKLGLRRRIHERSGVQDATVGLESKKSKIRKFLFDSGSDVCFLARHESMSAEANAEHKSSFVPPIHFEQAPDQQWPGTLHDIKQAAFASRGHDDEPICAVLHSSPRPADVSHRNQFTWL